MALDRSFIEHNRAATARIRDLASRLTDTDLQTPVGPDWTVAILLAHLAFWDRRVLIVMEKTEQEGTLYKPNLDVIANDIALPSWAAIPPRVAATLAINTAEELDRRLEAWSPARLEEMAKFNIRWVDRSLHRNEHLNEADAALAQKR